MAARLTLPPWKTRVAGKSFLFAGKHTFLEAHRTLAEQSGGILANGIDAKLDYLVLLSTLGTKRLEKATANSPAPISARPI
jgi:NAD-dependent DNA ligase